MIDVAQRDIGVGEIGGLQEGQHIRLSVSDTGAGMDEATIRRSIEPFFTTKGVGKGTGLGLSMVHGLAAQSGGTLELKSTIGQGTTATIWLPVSNRAPDVLGNQDPEVVHQTDPLLILLVDDEALVRRAVAQMLRELGHQVIEAASPSAALDEIRSRSDIQVIISDYLMPGTLGSDLIQQARQIRPHLKALLITGYARLTSDPTLAQLSKPFRVGDLAREIARLAGGAEFLADEETV